MNVLAVLMDKGIIIGVEHEAAARYSLPFMMFRIITSVCLLCLTSYCLA